jgi:hypothetical protein
MGTVFAARTAAGALVALKLMSEADLSEEAVSAFRTSLPSHVDASQQAPRATSTHRSIAFVSPTLLHGARIAWLKTVDIASRRRSSLSIDPAGRAAL